MTDCHASETRFAAPDVGWTFRYPSNLQVRNRAGAEGGDISLSDLRDPRNFFGFKVLLRARRFRAEEGFERAFADEVRGAQRGAAKRDHSEGPVSPATLAGHDGQQVDLRYTLDAGGVEYTDPEGNPRSTGDEPIALVLRLVAAACGDWFLTARLFADTERWEELRAAFDGIARTLRWREAS